MTPTNRVSKLLSVEKALLIAASILAAFGAVNWSVNPLNPDTYNYDRVRGFGTGGTFDGCADSTFYRGNSDTTDRLVFTFRHADTYHIHFKRDADGDTKSLLPADFDITVPASEVPRRANLYLKAPTASGWSWRVNYEKGKDGRGPGGCGVG